MALLPERNGTWSNWRTTPDRDRWVKPGLLKVVDTRRQGDPYDPYRQERGNIPNVGSPDVNWRNHWFMPSPTNQSDRTEYYSDREWYTADPMFQPYSLWASPWESPANGSGTPMPYDEHWDPTWIPVLSGDVAPWPGPGMLARSKKRTPEYSYYTDPSFLDAPLAAGWVLPADGGTLTYMGLTGFGGTRSYRCATSAGGPTFGMLIHMANPLSRPTHIFRLTCRVQALSGGEKQYAIGYWNTSGNYEYVGSQMISPGDGWVELTGTFSGERMHRWPGAYQVAINVLGGDTLTSFDISDIQLTDETVGPSTITDYSGQRPKIATRNDYAYSSCGCFQVLYDAYGPGGGGGGHPPLAWQSVRDRVQYTYGVDGNFSVSGSKAIDRYTRSYGGERDPRILSAPFSAHFQYDRYLGYHPFCFGWYWTVYGIVSQSVGYGYYDWTDVLDQKNWEMLLPSDVDPAFPTTLPYTWKRTYPPPYDGDYTVPGYWAPVEYNGSIEVVDSKFTIEIAKSAIDYGNSSGYEGCYWNTPAPPIPTGKFTLYAIDDANYDLQWPLTGGTVVCEILPIWSGFQNGTWTLTGVDFIGVETGSEYVLDTVADLGMTYSDTIYGAVLGIKPHTITSGRQAFYLVEEWGEAASLPWFITEYDPEANRGNSSMASSGFGTTHDLTQNRYRNSIAVSVQPYLKVRLPAQWRYAIPPEGGGGVTPPLRMTRRNDNVGWNEPSPRFQQNNDISGAASSSQRIFGNGNGAYDPP